MYVTWMLHVKHIAGTALDSLLEAGELGEGCSRRPPTAHPQGSLENKGMFSAYVPFDAFKYVLISSFEIRFFFRRVWRPRHPPTSNPHTDGQPLHVCPAASNKSAVLCTLCCV